MSFLHFISSITRVIVTSIKQNHLFYIFCTYSDSPSFISSWSFSPSYILQHRDLKLENVMVDIRGECPKLIDFGLANTFTHEQMLRTPCGSPFYAAPEILNRQCYSGPANDVWGLGVVLYCESTTTFIFRNLFPRIFRENIINRK